MDEDAKKALEFEKGFNDGYMLALYRPDTADRLAEIEKDTPRLNGIRAGRDQCNYDQSRYERNSYAQDKTQHKTLDKDKEPERYEGVDAEYQQGFNQGYVITKHLPELSDHLANVKSDAPSIEGFHEGRSERMLELQKDMRISKSKTAIRDTDHDLGKEPKEKDKDKDIEPEM
jgi:hypothetical protein